MRKKKTNASEKNEKQDWITGSEDISKHRDVGLQGANLSGIDWWSAVTNEYKLCVTESPALITE